MSWLNQNHHDVRDLGAVYLALALSYKGGKDAGWTLVQLRQLSEGTY